MGCFSSKAAVLDCDATTATSVPARASVLSAEPAGCNGLALADSSTAQRTATENIQSTDCLAATPDDFEELWDENKAKNAAKPLGAESDSFKSLRSNEWVVENDRLEYSVKIGGGSFGQVFLGRFRGAPVAIKRLHDRDLLGAVDANSARADRSLRALVREVELMARVRSPYVVMFMGVCLDPLACIQEYCAHGSLYNLLHQANKNPDLAAKLTWEQRLKMAMHTALGMYALHDKNILHRDLKSPNLMVDETFKVKVGDFGLSAFSPENGVSSGSSIIQELNRRWMAPEVAQAVLSQELFTFSKAADVYAYGLVLLELATFKIPFHDLSDTQVFCKASQGTLTPAVPSEEELVGGIFPAWPQYAELLQQCWAPNPDDRPTFEEISRVAATMLRAMRNPNADTKRVISSVSTTATSSTMAGSPCTSARTAS